jgi:hypothetical protein
MRAIGGMPQAWDAFRARVAASLPVLSARPIDADVRRRAATGRREPSKFSGQRSVIGRPPIDALIVEKRFSFVESIWMRWPASYGRSRRRPSGEGYYCKHLFLDDIHDF